MDRRELLGVLGAGTVGLATLSRATAAPDRIERPEEAKWLPASPRLGAGSTFDEAPARGANANIRGPEYFAWLKGACDCRSDAGRP